MKLQNMDPSVCAYEIFPQVVQKDVPTRFTARGLGIETALTPGAQYTLRVIGQEENNSAKILRISDWTLYDGIDATADERAAAIFLYLPAGADLYPAAGETGRKRGAHTPDRFPGVLRGRRSVLPHAPAGQYPLPRVHLRGRP